MAAPNNRICRELLVSVLNHARLAILTRQGRAVSSTELHMGDALLVAANLQDSFLLNHDTMPI